MDLEVKLDAWSKGSPKTADLELGETRVRVRTDATPAQLKQIRELVESRFDEMAQRKLRGVSAHQLTVLVAYSLAEDLLKERARTRATKKHLAEVTDRLISRIESHLGQDS